MGCVASDGSYKDQYFTIRVVCLGALVFEANIHQTTLWTFASDADTRFDRSAQGSKGEKIQNKSTDINVGKFNKY